jgi:hypothetical protein
MPTFKKGDSVAIELLVVGLLIAGSILAGNFLYTITLPGLRSGKLQARGKIYSRSSEPVRFWFGIVFFIFVFFMMFVLSANGIVHIWMSLK